MHPYLVAWPLLSAGVVDTSSRHLSDRDGVNRVGKESMTSEKKANEDSRISSNPADTDKFESQKTQSGKCE